MAGLPVPSYNSRLLTPQIGTNPLQLLTALIQQNQQGQNDAKQANESRYDDILNLFGLTRGRVMGNLSQLGNQQISDANKAYDDQRNNLMTDLADRGLSGSTKRIAVEDATKRERDAAVNRIQDSLLQNLSNADERFTDKATGVMERRSDPYPATGDIGGMISQLVGAFPGALGGGQQGPQPHYNNGGSAGTYGPTQAAPAATSQYFNPAYAKSQQLNQADAARQNAMTALTGAMNKGGIEGEDATRQALAYLQQNGWASQNPAQGVPEINFGRSITPGQQPRIAPTYNYAAPGSNQNYQNRFARQPLPGTSGNQFGIAGDPSSTGGVPQSGGLSPFGQLAGIFNMGSAAAQSASPYLSSLMSSLSNLQAPTQQPQMSMTPGYHFLGYAGGY